MSKKMVIEVLGGKPARWLVGWPVAAGRCVHPSHDDDPSDPALSRSHPPVPLSLQPFLRPRVDHHGVRDCCA